MRRFFRGVVFGMIAVFLVATSRGGAEPPSLKEIRIVTSFLPMFIMAENVAGGVDGVTIKNLTVPRTGCLHDAALTTEDMKVLAEADIFVASGAGMEGYLDRVVAQFPKLKVIRLADGLPLLRDARGGVNAHVWVSPTGAMAEVRALIEGLAVVDPARAAAYRQNGAVYLAALEALRARMAAVLASRVRVPVVTFHEAFDYFAEEFGLDVAAVIEREPGTAPSARELAATIDLVRGRGIKILFVEPQYASDVARVIAEETGARIYVHDPAVTGAGDKDAYLKAMEANLSVLKEVFPET
jgi:zinc transport system substrate-binding protein